MATNVNVTFDLIESGRTVDFPPQTGISYIYPSVSGVPVESADFTISNTDFTVDGTPSASSLEQSGGCHWEMTDGVTPSTIGIQSLLATNENIQFTVNNTHEFIAIYISCGGDTGMVEINLGGGPGYTFGTVQAAPSGYTRSFLGSQIDITSDSPSQPLYMLLEATGGGDFNTATITFTWPTANINLGPQGIASGDSAPSACFGEDTLIETENGGEKISTLKSGALVKVRDGEGKDHLVRAVVLQRVSIVHEIEVKNRLRIKKGVIAENYPFEDLVISKDHLILVPADIRDSLLRPAEERFKKDCYDHNGERCNTCAPFPIPSGFATILVRDMKPHLVEPDPYMGTNWWHLTLPQDEYPNGGAVVLSCGILAESHRTPSSILVKDQGWLLK